MTPQQKQFLNSKLPVFERDEARYFKSGGNTKAVNKTRRLTLLIAVYCNQNSGILIPICPFCQMALGSCCKVKQSKNLFKAPQKYELSRHLI